MGLGGGKAAGVHVFVLEPVLFMCALLLLVQCAAGHGGVPVVPTILNNLIVLQAVACNLACAGLSAHVRHGCGVCALVGALPLGQVALAAT